MSTPVAALILAAAPGCGVDSAAGPPVLADPAFVPVALAFRAQPPAGTAGQPLDPALKVELRHAGGAVVATATHAVTLSLASGPEGAALAGTTTVDAVGGVATFDDVLITTADPGYALSASAEGLHSDVTVSFEIVPGPPSVLAFTEEPPGARAGEPLPPIEVEVRDAYGNLVEDALEPVTLRLGANPADGRLDGTTTVQPVDGVARFEGISIARAAAGYRLSATAEGLPEAVGRSFAVIPAEAALLSFRTQPAAAGAGEPFPSPIEVEVLDVEGNRVPAPGIEVALFIASNPGAALLTGTRTAEAVDGVATFEDLTIDVPGQGYTLSATALDLAPAESAPFDVEAGPAAALAFVAQPGTTTAGQPLGAPLQVRVQDAGGNLVADGASEITVTLQDPLGDAVLLGTSTVTAVGGVASFSDLSVQTSGSGYTLTASAGGLQPAVSAAFEVVAGPGTGLGFINQPRKTQGQVPFTPGLRVSVRDVYGNTVRASQAEITMAIQDNPGGGTLSGTLTRTAVDGQATFNGLSIDRPGLDYTLVATADGLTPTTTNPFDIVLTFVQASVGNLFSCAVTIANRAYCWGRNDSGQLGDGTTDDADSPAPVAGGLPFVAIAAGQGSHACALTATGAAWCWGENGSGQLGDGGTSDSPDPVPVAGGHAFTAITTGAAHTCALNADGQAFCWGANQDGQLGDASMDDGHTPVASADGLQLAAIAAGGAHTCAITTAGVAHCWGANGDGQLGDGTDTPASVPVAVTGGQTFASITAGSAHTCALAPDGTAFCWGRNAQGQLGDGSGSGASAPVAVAGGLTWTGIGAGTAHTCAVSSAAEAYCWGENLHGEVGDMTTTPRTSPSRVDTPVTFESVLAGAWHSCGLAPDGQAFCWGRNDAGQLGTDSTTPAPAPAPVLQGTGATVQQDEPMDGGR